MSGWQTIPVRMVKGHGVASGSNGNPRFPGGTLRMQTPFFKALGLDIGDLHIGTVNVSIAPFCYRIGQPKFTFREVKWHPTEPAEDFSFFDVRASFASGDPVTGYIYYPHPETKPEHFQQPDVLELLLPYIDGLQVGAELMLELPVGQISAKGAEKNTIGK